MNGWMDDGGVTMGSAQAASEVLVNVLCHNLGRGSAVFKRYVYCVYSPYILYISHEGVKLL